MSTLPESLQIDHAVLGRYLANDCSAEERTIVEAWRSADPLAHSIVPLLQCHAIARDDGLAVDSAALWNRVVSRLDGRDTRRDRHASRTPARQWTRWLVRAGSGVALSAIVLVAGRMIVSERGGDRRHATRYATNAGQRATITLTDGTRVMLAPSSALQLDADFGASSRAVALSGEAYFDVTSIHAQPFVVRTGSVTTRVLGTAFSVRKYLADPAVRVAVRTGRVVMRDVREGRVPLTLDAGMVGEINDSLSRAVVAGDLAPYMAWTEERLVFRNATIAEIAATLGRTYAADIRVSDSVLRQRTATLTVPVASRSLDAVLDLLALTLDANVTYRDRVITIVPRAVRAPRSVPHRSDRSLLPVTQNGK
jgi:transmembrane sensor